MYIMSRASVPVELSSYINKCKDEQRKVDALAFYYEYIHANKKIPKEIADSMNIIFGYECGRSGIYDYTDDVKSFNVVYKYIDIDLNITKIFIDSDPHYFKGRLIYDTLYNYTYTM